MRSYHTADLLHFLGDVLSEVADDLLDGDASLPRVGGELEKTV